MREKGGRERRMGRGGLGGVRYGRRCEWGGWGKSKSGVRSMCGGIKKRL